MNYLKNIFSKILTWASSIFNKERVEGILDALAINNFKVNKTSYVLYWSIATFTITFTVWSLFASDDVDKGQILFLINNSVAINKYELAVSVRDTQKRKVELISELVKKGSEAEIRLIDEKLNLYSLEDSLLRAKLNLDYSKIISPVKGTISAVNAVNVDQVVNAGDEIATVVPFDDTLQVEALVQPKDIAYVIPGLKARLAFSAYDISVYGQFDGTVKTVAPNTIQLSPNDQPMYKTIIEINLGSSEKRKEINLQAGMQADVTIIGQPRTVASYIINPITKLSKTALRD